MATSVAKRIEGQFHNRCGKEVKLSQPDRKNATTDCRWVRNYTDVMVFSRHPLFLGGSENMFRVKAEPICADSNETYPHIGVTTISPDSQLPKDYGEMKKSQFYWYLIGDIAFHNRKEKKMSNELMVSSGDCYGCSVNVQGKLSVYKNEEELGVALEGLPTDQPLWAFTDVLDNKLTVDYLVMEGTFYSCEYKRTLLYFLSNPPAWLFCTICQELASNPMQATCCGNACCNGCIQKWQERSNTCPTCGSTPDSRRKFVFFEDVNMVRQINSLRVCCKNVKDGCRAVMDLSELKNHLTSCQFEKVICKNRGCGRKMISKIISDHETSQCCYRIVSCKYCQFRATFREIEDEHMKVCLEYPNVCSKNCGAPGLTRGTSKSHLRECPLEVVQCTNEECTIKLQRHALPNHLADDCPYRPIHCKYCDFQVAYVKNIYLEAHMKVCPKSPYVLVTCTNEKCSKKLQRCYLNNHLATSCAYRLVNCTYCNSKVTAIELDEYHMKYCLGYPVPCPNNCKTAGITRASLQDHCKECPFELTNCPNEKCQVTVQRCMLQYHVSNVCVYRLIHCQYCHMKVAFCEVNKGHQQVCLKHPIPCPNKCETTGLTRDTLEAHCKECPLEEIDCDYRGLGCEVRIIRSKMHSHLQDSMEYHLSLSAKEILRLRQENMEFKQDLNSKFHLLMSKLDELS